MWWGLICTCTLCTLDNLALGLITGKKSTKNETVLCNMSRIHEMNKSVELYWRLKTWGCDLPLQTEEDHLHIAHHVRIALLDTSVLLCCSNDPTCCMNTTRQEQSPHTHKLLILDELLNCTCYCRTKPPATSGQKGAFVVLSGHFRKVYSYIVRNRSTTY